MNPPVCAIATPSGRAAVGIIRISGEGSLSLISKIFFAKSTNTQLQDSPRKAIYGEIRNSAGLIDDVIVIPFTGKNSYTGEEAAEIHCHGNPIILKNVLAMLDKLGVRMAQPGEFTKRAYLNGKLDLTAAESVHEIISARNEHLLQSAQRLRKGEFRAKLYQLRTELMNLAADLSAELDFIDEDITFSEKEQKISTLDSVSKAIQTLLHDSESLRIYREGFMIAIIGAPNTGKSSLLNYLAGYERSIVSEIPGTTRDFVESQITIAGIEITFTDTAGLRHDAADIIEEEGIRRSLKKTSEADLVICMLDGSLEKDRALNESPLLTTEYMQTQVPKLVIVNKSDSLHSSWEKAPPEYLVVSLKAKISCEKIVSSIARAIEQLTPKTIGLSLSVWQSGVLGQMLAEIDRAKGLILENELPEIVAACVNTAVTHVAELTGEISSEDILGRIFSRFCIGK